ncbi:hypothetical protein EPUS_02693 [Endocarpon pusillum Z07020]|uniref:Uncharacterized protein n=1 Tax=Endocarpon pusillum (strain Z07020 / HMAS-L-300199) TaxID=1263415 RepID=U1FTZ8_ENDPU|nr:uncharacterized protein EPUS_02693 [Endocarpon pusillum Z07020]ERF68237.1 hypothetical protein EPUS_02693 [Endocarpon pusillum Z07020]
MSDTEEATPSREMRLVSSSLHPLPPKTLKQETRFWARGSGVTTLWTILAILCTPLLAYFVLVSCYGTFQRRQNVIGASLLEPCFADWSWMGIFEVNIAFGSFTYLQAKYLDAAWNLLVGKTSQALAAWICYKVFAMALLRITERSRVSFRLYTATAFYPTDFLTLWKYVRGLAVSRTARERAILVWFCFAAAYVLTLSTILDLVTGYVTTQEAAVSLADGGFASLRGVRWFDGAYKELYSYDVSVYPNKSDISVHTLSGQNFTYLDLIDNSTSVWKQPPIVCMQGSKYRWGFSVGWIWILLPSTLIWISGMFGMYVDAMNHDFLWQMGRRPGVYRDILDVAEAIQEELGPDTCGYSDKELSREIDRLDAIGFVGLQEGNVQNIRLSTRISDVYDGLGNEDMSCERLGTAMSPR